MNNIDLMVSIQTFKYSVSKTVEGQSLPFEVVSTDIEDSKLIEEINLCK